MNLGASVAPRMAQAASQSQVSKVDITRCPFAFGSKVVCAELFFLFPSPFPFVVPVFGLPRAIFPSRASNRIVHKSDLC